MVFTSNKRILTQLNLVWGVKAFFYDSFESTDKTVEQINEIATNKGYVNKGDLLVNLTAMPIIEKGMVNTLRVSSVWKKKKLKLTFNKSDKYKTLKRQ